MTNDRYTPDELESIFVWDCVCEAMPLTAEERREINERDRQVLADRFPAPTVKRKRQNRVDMPPDRLEALRAKDRERKHNAPKPGRSEASMADNRERMAEYYRIHRQEILARQKQRRLEKTGKAADA